MIADHTRSWLLRHARASIAQHLGADIDSPESPTDGVLQEARGAFVTLHREGRLRGCIGRVESDWPLHETIARMAVASAFEDPRFAPLTKDELDECSIEVSVLSPPRAVATIDQIVVGRHGLIVASPAGRGLLLPQVAEEWDWDTQTFVEQTCLKAGLATQAWENDDTTLSVFEAEVFSE